MPKILAQHVRDVELKRNFDALYFLLNGMLDMENFKGTKVTGTTAGTAHTSKQFKHSFKGVPTICLILIGNVYIFEKTSDYIDVRSDQTNVNFEIFLIGGKI